MSTAPIVKTSSPPKTKGIFLKSLLVRAHGSFSPNQLAPLPASWRSDLELSLKSNPEISPQLLATPSPLIHQGERTLSIIHYSWLFSPLKKFSKYKRKILISNLSEKQQKGLKKLFNEEFSTSTSLFSRHLENQLTHALNIREHLPLEYLPETPKNKLLRLSKEDLVRVIDYLAFFDLAVELRTVIAKEQLKKIFAIIPKEEQKFLIKCMKLNDRLTPSKLSLDKWAGKKEDLLRQLHMRGLARLGYALSGEHPDLIWYISRILDTGRGNELLNFVKSQKIEQLTKAASLQLQNVINHLFEKGTT